MVFTASMANMYKFVPAPESEFWAKFPKLKQEPEISEEEYLKQVNFFFKNIFNQSFQIMAKFCD